MHGSKWLSMHMVEGVDFSFSSVASCNKPMLYLILSRFDAGKDNYIDLMELKLMMEKLGAPQTHIGLKNMIKEVDEDLDNKLSFREVQQKNTRLESVT